MILTGVVPTPMDIFEYNIDTKPYRIRAQGFEVFDRNAEPFPRIEAITSGQRTTGQPTAIRLDGTGETKKERIVYTVGLDMSQRTDMTIPIFEVQIPAVDPEWEKEQREKMSPGQSATGYERIRELFIDEDADGTIQGLGPIGKCLNASQDQKVILFLRGIDRLPGRAQSSFFEVFERCKISYGVEVSGNPDNLTIFSTKGSSAAAEPLDRKFKRLLGATYVID